MKAESYSIVSGTASAVVAQKRIKLGGIHSSGRVSFKFLVRYKEVDLSGGLLYCPGGEAARFMEIHVVASGKCLRLALGS